MMTILRTVLLGSGLAAVALTSSTPALADHRGGDTTGAAIAGGIVGLAVGAAVASSARRDRWDDWGGPRRYWGGPRYRAYVYHAYPPPYSYRDWNRYRWERERWERWRWQNRAWRNRDWHGRGWDGPRYWDGPRHWDGPRGW
ncbi:hypothetical protein [Novosphingobium sp.]|uniref:hypothetical protein n=1 Tax=Novosphingobium sp. TaxID=1874826 RepID=UPI00261A9EC9|nr:hypothetical protein [Novosphingobium sp.]